LNLKDRVAVITGAASGIGRATALSLARRGCHLALADIDEAGLGQTQAQASSAGVRISAHRLDVASREAVAALPAEILKGHGRVDLLVNNAGVALAIARNARVAQDVPADELRRRLALADRALRLPPEKAGEIIVRGVERRRARILVGRDAAIISLMERLVPVNYWRVLGPRLR
jgi:NAD(P)-dependent dehydrogenase (short-subunit alcohol dehydrogenase family)